MIAAVVAAVFIRYDHQPCPMPDSFDSWIDDSLAGFDGEIPPGVDEAAVKRMQTVARVFDDLVRIPGTDFRVGIDPVLGLVPVVGDALSAGLSLYVVLESARLGVTYTTLLRMLANITIDAAVGSVPVVGDLFDAVWKVNKRNLEMAIEDLTDGAVERLDDGTGDGDGEDGAIEIEIE